MTPLILTLALLACGPEFEPRGSSDGGDDTAEDTDIAGATSVPVFCDLDPMPETSIATVRVGPTGEVLVGDGSRIYRYERTDDGSGCTLVGSQIWDEGHLEDAQDFDVDDAGNVVLLAFFSTLVRLGPDATEHFRCEVESSHGMTVTGDGSRAYVAAIGTEELHWADITDDGCTASGGFTALPHGIGTAPEASGALLAVDAHDSQGKLPPGFLLDPATGEVLDELGGGADPSTADEMVAFNDIVLARDGYWASGVPDGDLWHLDEQGVVTLRYEADTFFPVPDDPDPVLSVRSVGYSASFPSYVAAGWGSFEGVWTVEL